MSLGLVMFGVVVVLVPNIRHSLFKMMILFADPPYERMRSDSFMLSIVGDLE